MTTHKFFAGNIFCAWSTLVLLGSSAPATREDKITALNYIKEKLDGTTGSEKRKSDDQISEIQVAGTSKKAQLDPIDSTGRQDIEVVIDDDPAPEGVTPADLKCEMCGVEVQYGEDYTTHLRAEHRVQQHLRRYLHRAVRKRDGEQRQQEVITLEEEE